jgi:hypothetical protein
MSNSRFYAEDQANAKRTDSGHVVYFVWLILLGAAAVVYELSSNGMLSAAMLAGDAGWSSLWCGWWLLRADPQRARAWVCFWFYLAAACLRTAVVALLIVLIFIWIECKMGQQVPEAERNAVLLAWFGGLFLATVLGDVAIALALRAKVRVWVHPSVRRRCRGDFTHIGDVRPGYCDFNHAFAVVVISLTTSVIGAVAIPLSSPAEENWLSHTLLVLMFVGLFAMIPVYAWLSPRVIADGPEDCWPA